MAKSSCGELPGVQLLGKDHRRGIGPRPTGGERETRPARSLDRLGSGGLGLRPGPLGQDLGIVPHGEVQGLRERERHLFRAKGRWPSHESDDCQQVESRAGSARGLGVGPSHAVFLHAMGARRVRKGSMILHSTETGESQRHWCEEASVPEARECNFCADRGAAPPAPETEMRVVRGSPGILGPAPHLAPGVLQNGVVGVEAVACTRPRTR